MKKKDEDKEPLQHEEFRKLEEFPNYSISSFGRVCNEKLGKMLCGCVIRRDVQVRLRGKDGKQHNVSVDRLVAETFIPGCGDHHYVVHKDGRYMNNRAENLEWREYGKKYECKNKKYGIDKMSDKNITKFTYGYVVTDELGETEEFRYLKEYPGYSVSNKGRVKNENRDRFLNPSYQTNGYRVKLVDEQGNVVPEYVARLVAMAFIPGGGRGFNVKHIDGSVWNNNLSNLRWEPVKSKQLII